MNIRTLIALSLFAGSAALLWMAFFPAEAPAPAPALAMDETLYESRDWNTASEDSVNISVYTFRDLNRNGNYDVGDLPMANIGVKMTAPDGAKAGRATGSNINGYANFKMALGNSKHPVNTVGEYDFEVLPPPGWKITTGNTTQRIRFRQLPGSIAGIVAEQPPHWVGLSPDLYIEVQPDENMPREKKLNRINAVSSTGELIDHKVREGQPNRIPLHPGNWTVTGETPAGNQAFKQQVRVTDSPVFISPSLADAASSTPLPRAVTEDFEWLNRAIIDKLPNGHLGLHWDYLLAVDNQYYQGPGYVNGLISGHAVAYNSSGHPVTISAPDGQRFDFVGGSFAVAWPKAQGEILQVTAWRNNQPVSSANITLSYLGPIRFEPDFRGIDKLTLSTKHYWQFVADDLEFRLPNA